MASFLDSIIDVGSSVWDWATGSSMSAGIARATALGFMLKEVQDSINKENEQDKIPKNGVREQVDPDTSNSIPVVYGSAYIQGSVVDAVMSDDNMHMWYCIALCEQTGTLMSTQQPSRITIDEVYWNTSRVEFRADGVTASLLSDEDGNTSSDIDGLVKFYPFSGSSGLPSKITGQSGQNTSSAISLFPNWTDNHTMSDLVFCLVHVEYNAVKKITGLGRLEFKVTNTMTQPGDCLYDYITNNRYGGGISPEEINQ